MRDYILVTDWERVEKDDFYLTKQWEDLKKTKEARKLQKEGKLYIGYIVLATNYAIYTAMDAEQVFINDDMDVILRCETSTIANNHEKAIEYNY